MAVVVVVVAEVAAIGTEREAPPRLSGAASLTCCALHIKAVIDVIDRPYSLGVLNCRGAL